MNRALDRCFIVRLDTETLSRLEGWRRAEIARCRTPLSRAEAARRLLARALPPPRQRLRDRTQGLLPFG